MLIAIDNISPGESTSINAPGGMRNYLKSLLVEFARQRPNHEFLVYCGNRDQPLFEEWPSNVTPDYLPFAPSSRVLRVPYQQLALAAASRKRTPDVFFATATVAPLFVTMPVVLAVQFLQFREFPGVYGRARSAYLSYFLPLSVRRAAATITFTESAKQQLLELVRVPPDRVKVVHHGLSVRTQAASGSDGRSQAACELTGGAPYLLYVSATYGYKNHVRLVKAYAQLKQRSSFPHKLLLVGAEVHVSFRELRELAAECDVEHDVIIAGRVNNVDCLYRHADVSVIPTLSETFGFPIIEAMALGCPVITSNYGSMAELAGDAAVLVNPLDEGSIARGIERVLSDQTLRERLVQQGLARAAQFSWAKSAAETIATIEGAALR